jgi:hypothetical protein
VVPINVQSIAESRPGQVRFVEQLDLLLDAVSPGALLAFGFFPSCVIRLRECGAEVSGSIKGPSQGHGFDTVRSR